MADAYGEFRRPGRIATAYCVGRESEKAGQTSLACEVFPDRKWAYHLGTKGTNWFDRHSVGVELANVGALRRRDNYLCWWPRGWTARYCSLAELTQYREATLMVGDERVDYWAAFTEPQIEAAIALVVHLCEKFDIPKTLVDDPNEPMDYDRLKAMSGVFGHRNYRPDKYDPGLGFPWGRLREALEPSRAPTRADPPRRGTGDRPPPGNAADEAEDAGNGGFWTALLAWLAGLLTKG